MPKVCGHNHSVRPFRWFDPRRYFVAHLEAELGRLTYFLAGLCRYEWLIGSTCSQDKHD